MRIALISVIAITVMALFAYTGVQTSESGALVSADVFCSRVVLVPVHGVQSEQIRALVFTKGKARVDFR